MEVKICLNESVNRQASSSSLTAGAVRGYMARRILNGLHQKKDDGIDALGNEVATLESTNSDLAACFSFKRQAPICCRCDDSFPRIAQKFEPGLTDYRPQYHGFVLPEMPVIYLQQTDVIHTSGGGRFSLSLYPDIEQLDKWKYSLDDELLLSRIRIADLFSKGIHESETNKVSANCVARIGNQFWVARIRALSSLKKGRRPSELPGRGFVPLLVRPLILEPNKVDDITCALDRGVSSKETHETPDAMIV